MWPTRNFSAIRDSLVSLGTPVIAVHLPELHAKLVKRMIFGNKVIDQEVVYGVPGAPLDGAAIYEVTDRGISKVWFVRAT